MGRLGNAMRHPSFAIGFVLSATLALIGIVSVVWTPFAIDSIEIARRFQGPGEMHWLGTDHLGRDMVSLLMAGTLTSFVVAISSVAIGAGIGVPLGLLAVTYGGAFQWLTLRLSDLIFAFPALIVAILITALFGPGAINAIVAIGIFNIPVFARVARGGALAIWTLDYVSAARLAGLNPMLIARRHLLPNIAGLIIVQATIQLSLGILAEAGLSYIGLGTQPPATSLGLMLRDSQSLFLLHPALSILPGVAIALIVIGLNLMGDGLRDLLDPRLRAQGAVNVAA
jgi:peptide/nickel transport system permease protein